MFFFVVLMTLIFLRYIGIPKNQAIVIMHVMVSKENKLIVIIVRMMVFVL